jgi:hypothetical protein
MQNQLKNILEAAKEKISASDATEALEVLRVEFLGKKGALTAILRQMGSLSAEERPVVGALAMISGFAGGGIVGGSSTIGDYNVIRANKGEMILNSTQQANLFRMLNSGGASRGMDGEVKFKISGKELIGVLNNYNRKTAKVK